MNGMPELTLVFTFFAGSLLAGVPLLWYFGRDKGVIDRLQDLRDSHLMAARTRFQQSRHKEEDGLLGKLTRLGAALHPGSDSARQRVAQQFLHAGIYRIGGPSLFAGVRFMAGIALPVLLLLSGRLGIVNPLPAAILAGVSVLLGYLGLSAWLRSRIASHQRELRRSLPDFLDLMGACLQAGQSFEAALTRVTDELRPAHPTLTLELTIVQREMTLGSSPARALRGFASRCGMDIVRQLATLVDQSQRFGAGVTEALRIYSDMLRMQRSQRAETLAHKAGVKILFPTLLFIFPPVLIILAGPAVIDLHEKFVHRNGAAATP
jgi:tight adherence protein C